MRVRPEFRPGKEICPLIRAVRLLESPLIEDYTVDPFGNVNLKLSDNVFSKSEFSLLHKNLDFCSRPNKYNKQNLKKDLLKLYRNIKLRAHFGSTGNNSNEPRFNSNSNWLPD